MQGGGGEVNIDGCHSGRTYLPTLFTRVKKLLDTCLATLLHASLLIALKTELELSFQVPQMFLEDLDINQNVNIEELLLFSI